MSFETPNFNNNPPESEPKPEERRLKIGPAKAAEMLGVRPMSLLKMAAEGQIERIKPRFPEEGAYFDRDKIMGYLEEFVKQRQKAAEGKLETVEQYFARKSGEKGQEKSEPAKISEALESKKEKEEALPSLEKFRESNRALIEEHDKSMAKAFDTPRGDKEFGELEKKVILLGKQLEEAYRGFYKSFSTEQLLDEYVYDLLKAPSFKTASENTRYGTVRRLLLERGTPEKDLKNLEMDKDRLQKTKEKK